MCLTPKWYLFNLQMPIQHSTQILNVSKTPFNYTSEWAFWGLAYMMSYKMGTIFLYQNLKQSKKYLNLLQLQWTPQMKEQ